MDISAALNCYHNEWLELRSNKLYAREATADDIASLALAKKKVRAKATA
jgi:hypothetical protein